ncbi:MAG: ATP-binding protein [Butyricicoccus sp.]
MAGNPQKKSTGIVNAAIGALAVVLAILIVWMMNLVSGIQGTARIINYAGLVRGKTQRIVKLEISGQPQDGMIADIDAFIDGLRFGSDELSLVRLNNDAFQSKMQELDDYFQALKQEIGRVRAVGSNNTDIIPISETFFGICDDATGLAEAYSQRKATSLSALEKYITADIVVLMLLIGYQLFQALHTAAMNRALQHKVYLDAATGLPNKNKCEELLDDPTPPAPETGVCSFDLNNLRRINNSMGHEAGDAYIRRFAVALRAAMPEKHFVGRTGGDEFLAITHGPDADALQKLLSHVRKQLAEESRQHPDTPLSYAAGFALASDNPDSNMRDLFDLADKNMYINKNRRARKPPPKSGGFSAWSQPPAPPFRLYCDARLDTYRTIRACESFFLASDGSYTGAVEQIAEEQAAKSERSRVRSALQLDVLQRSLHSAEDTLELQYNAAEESRYSRLTVLPIDWDEAGVLHHFILAFETIRLNADQAIDPKEQLTLYYEQLKQSILENDSYVDALLDMAGTIYTVNLTRDTLERNISPAGKSDSDRALFLDYPLPCSYRDYCDEYRKRVTPATLGSYRTADTSARLLKRFAAGEKHITVEYCVQEDDGAIRWVQKTVLMTQTTMFDPEINAEMPMVTAIILLQDTSQMHARDEQENARLQAAFDEMRIANRTKTEFLSRMSHDIRTPLNGIIGLLQVDETHFDDKALLLENHKKMQISANHLLSLINDVLQMSKLEEGTTVLTHERISLVELTRDIITIIIGRAEEAGIEWEYEKDKSIIPYPYIYGSPLHLRQIFLNIYSNCIKYNRPGGKITTHTDSLGEQDGKCTYRWTISDTGIGMSPDFVDHIFEPFTQEKQDARSYYHGTGLGMTITKELVDRMGGSITVTSQLGVGSTFVITLPFEIAPSPEQTPDAHAAPDISIAGCKLLLVEDNALNAEIAQILLTDEGATVTVVTDGKQAVEIVQNNPPDTFDAVLMDVMMPVMNGIDAAKTIRSLNRPDAKTLPIIAMTANAFYEDAQKCLAAGMNAHLAKPLQIKKVKQTIAEWVKNNRTAKKDA